MPREKVSLAHLASGQSRGMTPVALACDMGVSHTSVLRAEARHRKRLPRRNSKTARKLLDDVLGMPPADAVEILTSALRDLCAIHDNAIDAPELVDCGLTPNERHMVSVLLQNEGREVSRDWLMAAIYGLSDSPPEEKILSVMASRIRRKAPHLLDLACVYGVGYVCKRRPDVVFSWE